jgi:hypothetical protein
MNDELQRRLEAADPLTAGNGVARTPAQLEKMKEYVLMNDKNIRAGSPRWAGIAALGSVALAGVILFGGLAGAEKTLAFSASATMATAEQAAAADAACTAPIDGASGMDLELKSLELFGNGGVALYGNDEIYGYCMVLVSGDTVEAGIRISGNAPELTQFIEAAGSTEFADQTVSIIVGNAPEGATSVEVVGLDGVSATVVEGRYGLWLPQAFADSAIELVARDQDGNELLREGLPWRDGATEPTR